MTQSQVFSCTFCEISKNTFSYRTSSVAASHYESLFFVMSLNQLDHLCDWIRWILVLIDLERTRFERTRTWFGKTFLKPNGNQNEVLYFTVILR